MRAVIFLTVLEISTQLFLSKNKLFALILLHFSLKSSIISYRDSLELTFGKQDILTLQFRLLKPPACRDIQPDIALHKKKTEKQTNMRNKARLIFMYLQHQTGFPQREIKILLLLCTVESKPQIYHRFLLLVNTKIHFVLDLKNVNILNSQKKLSQVAMRDLGQFVCVSRQIYFIIESLFSHLSLILNVLIRNE